MKSHEKYISSMQIKCPATSIKVCQITQAHMRIVFKTPHPSGLFPGISDFIPGLLHMDKASLRFTSYKYLCLFIFKVTFNLEFCWMLQLFKQKRLSGLKLPTYGVKNYMVAF